MRYDHNIILFHTIKKVLPVGQSVCVPSLVHDLAAGHPVQSISPSRLKAKSEREGEKREKKREEGM